MDSPENLGDLARQLRECIEALPRDDSRASKRWTAELFRREYISQLTRKRPEFAQEPPPYVNRLAKGETLHPEAIRPKLVICESSEDYRLHLYFSAYSRLPTRD